MRLQSSEQTCILNVLAAAGSDVYISFRHDFLFHPPSVPVYHKEYSLVA